ncbi:MAG: S8 family serine peptidase, partial [Sedimenticolaceae bacterium]
MHFPRISVLALLLILVSLCITAGAIAEEGFAEGRILVKPAAGMKTEKLDRLLQKIDKKLKRKRKLRGSSVQMIEVPPKAEKAMARLLRKHPHIAFAVLDTGVNPNHPDLAGQVLSGWNTVSNNADTADINNHGTW